MDRELGALFLAFVPGIALVPPAEQPDERVGTNPETRSRSRASRFFGAGLYPDQQSDGPARRFLKKPSA